MLISTLKISRPLYQAGAHEPASCMCSSCSRSSYLAETDLNLSPKQRRQAFKQRNKNMSHFPLSLMASSNLPSAMAVVTSLVWTGGEKMEQVSLFWTKSINWVETLSYGNFSSLNAKRQSPVQGKSWSPVETADMGKAIFSLSSNIIKHHNASW